MRFGPFSVFLFQSSLWRFFSSFFLAGIGIGIGIGNGCGSVMDDTPQAKQVFLFFEATTVGV